MPDPAITEADIALLVDLFYAKVRADAALAPVFQAAIGDDPAHWDAHLVKLRRFWSAIMLRSGAYQGEPFTTHLRLSGLTPDLFPQWLALFEATCRDLFPEATAEAFSDKANRIARSLRMGIFDRLPEMRVRSAASEA